MKKYKVRISKQAFVDIENLRFVIVNLYKSPITASRYVHELMATINALSVSADSFPVSTLKSVSKYGYNARRINFKKMAIVFTIHGNIVLIQRVVSGALLSES
jgi:hypothetical protein